MKLGRLYIKIFLSFIIFLIITEAAIFGFFIIFAGRFNHKQFEKQNMEKLAVVSQMISREIHGSKAPLTGNLHALQDLTNRLSIALRAKIWITTADDQILLKSFPEAIPYRVVDKIKRKEAEFLNQRFFKFQSYFLNLYKVKQLPAVNNTRLTLHILFMDHMPDHGGFRFAIGLLGIGIIAALLVIPISRQISRPVNSLTRSASLIERGNLSHRAVITTKDEIGELGKAFNRMADKVESMIKGGRELTAQVSHELRSPLARIQLAVEMIRDKLQEESSPENDIHLAGIQEDIDELDHLIGRILAHSKLDLHETDYTADRISPVVELEACLNKSITLMDAGAITLEKDFQASPEINGHRETLVTALANLVDNAVKYTPPEGRISASAEQTTSSLILTLSNTAQPIPPTELDRIFDPFFRANSEEREGVGLGLAITRRIIEKHGGTITVQQTDQMFKFMIDLPVSA